MKDNQSEQSMGEQIRDALSDALQSGNYNDLNRLVSQSVTAVLNEVGKHISFMDYDGEDRGTGQSSSYQYNKQAETSREDFRRQQAQEQTYRQTQGQTGQGRTQAQQQGHDQSRQAKEQTWQQSGRQQGQSWQQSGGQTGHAWQQTGQTSDWQQAPRQTQEQTRRQAKQQARQVHEQVRQAREQAKQTRQEQARRQAQQIYGNAGSTQRQNNPYQNVPQAVPNQQFPSTAFPFPFKKVGNVSGVLYKVFGGIGLGVTSLITFFHFTLLLTDETLSVAGWVANALFLALFAGMIRLGIGQHRRLKLAERYAGLCGRNLYGEIEQLAKSTGRKTRRVIKDLQKMLSLGMFPEGHLDEQKTCFMLNDGIYRQYLETENNRKLREEESRRIAADKDRQNAAEAETKSGQTPGLSEQEAELNAMVAEGMECIRKLHILNDKIPGEVISAKLFRLENLLKSLFDSVREHPEQMHRMHKLMNYYLPTTLKLVEAYEEFDRVSVPGDDIIAAKAEIENTLDTINQAFTELLNNLFQDAVLDATTDAQVLKTMLAREGLMNEMGSGQPS